MVAIPRMRGTVREQKTDMNTFRSGLGGCLVMLWALAAASGAAATEYTWPGSAPCDGTLQACIDAVASGDIIDLAPAGPINESLNVAKSLTLRPLALALTAAGEPLPPPLFSAGNYIAVSANSGSSFYFELDGVVLQRGHVFLGNYNTAAAEFHVRGVTLIAVDNDIYGGIAMVSYVATAPLSVFLENNRVTLTPDPRSGLPYAGIGIHGASQNLLASISWNHVDQLGGSPSAIGIYADVEGSSSVAIVGNRVKGTAGGLGLAGIYVINGSTTIASGPVKVTSNAVSDENATATTPALYVGTNGGTLPAQVINNTLVRSGEGLMVQGAVTGMVANNIFADAIYVLPGSMGNEYNLLWNVGTFGGTPGPGTVNADPMLTDDLNLRVVWPHPSPARDAGNNADLPFLSINDADQRPRIRNTTVDLGAYETGDLAWQHVATNANIVFNETDLDNAAINCCDFVPIFATASMTGETVEPVIDSGYLGVYYSGTYWAVFHQNTGLPMTPGAVFNLFYPVSVASNHAFTQTVTAANTFGLCMLIDNPETNNHADALLEVTANWNPLSGAGVYDNHPLNIAYNAGQHRWVVCHDDGAAITSGASYNIFVSPLLVTPNAFIAQASAAAPALALDHPLLNNNPCAAIQVTAATPTLGQTSKVAVQYFRHGDSGRWAIVPAPTESGTPATLAAFALYHVYVDGAQANACRDDLIFASGFYQ